MINNYRCFHKPNVLGVNRLLVLVYSDQHKYSSRYCLPKGVIKNYNVIINGKKRLWPTHWFSYNTILTNKKFKNSAHLRQSFLYSEDVNENPAELFVRPYLNVFSIYQHHYLPKKKIYWTKKQRFDDVTFAMEIWMILVES